MKTNQCILRPMGDFQVFQRTEDGYFDGNALLAQWNSQEDKPRRRMSEFTDSPKTKKFIDTIVSRESQCRKGDNADIQPLIIRKGRATIKGRAKDKVWMHPLLFIDFAMWINPEFKYDVLKFVYDQLIQYRIEAGNSYKEMAEQIAKISKKGQASINIPSVARAINIIVYGKHEKELRNKQAEERSMMELVKMQIKVTELIKEGFIKSYEQLINYLRKIWIDKNQPRELAM